MCQKKLDGGQRFINIKKNGQRILSRLRGEKTRIFNAIIFISIKGMSFKQTPKFFFFFLVLKKGKKRGGVY